MRVKNSLMLSGHSPGSEPRIVLSPEQVERIRINREAARERRNQMLAMRNAGLVPCTATPEVGPAVAELPPPPVPARIVAAVPRPKAPSNPRSLGA